MTKECRQGFPDNVPLSDGLKQAIIATMQPDPENRPQSVKAWLELLPTVTVSPPTPPTPSKTTSVSPSPLIGGTLFFDLVEVREDS
ncbi:MAG: hypothetical protein GDA44_02100 [Prochloron sp. SP5CPC1]|nr:hypothetical protein [Candidatus Paraprochloron terpiosi SP5CPC1]